MPILTSHNRQAATRARPAPISVMTPAKAPLLVFLLKADISKVKTAHRVIIISGITQPKANSGIMNIIISYLLSYRNTARRVVTDVFRLHILEIACDRFIHLLKKGLGIEPHKKYKKDNSAEYHRFPFRNILKFFIFFLRYLPEHDPLKHPQHVHGAKNYSRGRQNPIEDVASVNAGQDEEFAYKAVRAGQGNGGKSDDHEKNGQPRHDFGQAAEVGDHPRMPSLIDHADDEE